MFKILNRLANVIELIEEKYADNPKGRNDLIDSMKDILEQHKVKMEISNGQKDS